MEGDGHISECFDDSGDGRHPDREEDADPTFAYAAKCIRRIQTIVPSATLPECSEEDMESACQLARKGKNRSALDKLGKNGVASRPAAALKAALQPQLAQVASGLLGEKQEDEVLGLEAALDIKDMMSEDKAGAIIKFLQKGLKNRGVDAWGISREAADKFTAKLSKDMIRLYQAIGSGWVPPLSFAFLTQGRSMGIEKKMSSVLRAIAMGSNILLPLDKHLSEHIGKIVKGNC